VAAVHAPSLRPPGRRLLVARLIAPR